MITELLIATVGSSIAKLVFAWWLKKPEFATEATLDIIDYFSKLTGDKLAARRGNRQYEVLSEKAAERLSYFLECEFWGYSENMLTPICFAVTDTLNSTPISSELILRSNISPQELFDNYHGKARKFIGAFSDGEKGIYYRLLLEVCTLVIDYSLEMPNFTPRTLGEVLKREDIIISNIEKVSEQVKQLQENTYKSSETANRAFDIEYKRSVLHNLGWMELFGIDLSVASRKHSLNIAYINLSVRKSTNGAGLKDITLRADQAINTARCLYIKGPAGSGKTTLLKWIAVNAASENFDDTLREWNYLTPFFIRLRQCVDLKDLPAPESFPKFIDPHIYGEMPNGWVHSRLRNGEAVVLIDGVDEISRRQEVMHWVEELSGTFSKSRFIITSRPLAQSDKWETPKGFVDAELLPMEPTDISLFVGNWHEAVKAELNDHELIDKMDSLSEKLIEAIHKNNNVRSLASTPLLCAMICALHRDKNQQLPSNRLDLYEACTKMLVDEREHAREIRIDYFPNFTYKEKEMLISDLAFFLLNNGYSEIPMARAKDRISRSLRSLRSKTKNMSASNVTDYLIERTGLLREPALGVVDFAHRTFQEYLSAKKAIDEDEIGLLVKNARDAQWREVIILAAGLANRKQKEELLTDLILRGDCEPENRYWFHLLAIACLETITDVDPELLADIKERIELLIPPRDISESIALASAGDLAVPHLEYSKGHSPKECITTLEYINTPLSIQSLLDYVKLPSQQVINLLLPALDRISKNQESNKLLTDIEMPDIKLTGERVRIIKYVNRIDKLCIRDFAGTIIPSIKTLKTRELEIINCHKLVALTGISNIKTLRILGIYSCPRLGLDELSLTNQLVGLTLDKTGTSDINDIVTLTNLTNLKLSNLPIHDLSSIIRMVNLRKLVIESCSELYDLQGLERLISLRWLLIKHCPKITDLNSLEGLRRLEKIELKFTEEETGLGIINKMSRSLQTKVQWA